MKINYIFHILCCCCSRAGAKSIVLVIIDGGADWMATQAAVVAKYPWISFMHCVPHETSLIIKDIFKIDVLDRLITWVTDAQKWFSTNKVGPLLQGFCEEHYSTCRKFVWPADTRFGHKLLQIKRFLSMESQTSKYNVRPMESRLEDDTTDSSGHDEDDDEAGECDDDSCDESGGDSHSSSPVNSGDDNANDLFDTDDD